MARALNPANLTYELQVQRRERIQICMEDRNVPLDRAEEIADAEIGREQKQGELWTCVNNL
jgi:hypothetical protein